MSERDEKDAASRSALPRQDATGLDVPAGRAADVPRERERATITGERPEDARRREDEAKERVSERGREASEPEGIDEPAALGEQDRAAERVARSVPPRPADADEKPH